MTAILQKDPSRFQIPGDKSRWDFLVDDMRRHGGDLAPNEHWHLENAGIQEAKALAEVVDRTGKVTGNVFAASDDWYENKYASLEMMLDPWIGSEGMRPPDEGRVECYRDFLERIDSLSLLPRSWTAADLAQANWLMTDMGSVMDVNLLAAAYKQLQGNILFSFETATPAYILEVGGGYGRLAEACLSLGQAGSCKYVLLDAVPASLLYAELYLRKALPAHRIGSFAAGDPFDMARFDAYILPTWHFEALNNISYDITVNIESMQEMSQWHVDYYLNLFNRVTKDDGIIYLSNAHDYVFKGSWNYPSDWERLYIANTPRSWSPDHPTEIFCKRPGKAHSALNAALESGYRYMLRDSLRCVSLQADNAQQWQRILQMHNELEDKENTIASLRQIHNHSGA